MTTKPTSALFSISFVSAYFFEKTFSQPDVFSISEATFNRVVLEPTNFAG